MLKKLLICNFVLLAGLLMSLAFAEERDEVKPDITIKQSEQVTIEEYRINGQLYMIKVLPKKGLPYFLVDSDGDGDLETRRSELEPSVLVPSWVLFSW